MSDVQGVNERNWILTLFIRDDGERFLLGDGAYEFKDTQKHFTAPTVENDTVEVQGNDGIMLAGQVRRPNTQEFDGFVGDATATKEEIEEKRKAFLGFFLTRHTYTAIYIFENGKAIQRRGGFIVDAPEVKELWQIHPEYHVALNFEDINYYDYAEDEEGQEAYGNIYNLINTRATSGGLVWDEVGVVWKGIRPEMFYIDAPYLLASFNSSNGVITEDPTLNAEVVGDTIHITSPTKNYQGLVYDFIPVQPNTEYALKCLGSDENFYSAVALYDGSMTYQNRMESINRRGTDREKIFTTGEATRFVRPVFERSIADATELTITNISLKPTSGDTDSGAVWEGGSGETENNITVESIDTVYPILTITGMAQDIVIENSRTGDVMEYVGNVADGQTLVIDMQNQTAKLNGVNVVGNIVGDWLRLEPGQNRVLYDAATDDNSEATLEWQEIVG